ncbi:hypothetical protein KKG22_04835 [Patescibacteria group bacterium]|nr:hypothetical protein [Patescibacteria group bacterium]MBU1721661.1 hypothetical protein [Patescibacteria group bacterium]MBU1900970.1 hypothetical protein [Patescibacteria group bacterium]
MEEKKCACGAPLNDHLKCPLHCEDEDKECPHCKHCCPDKKEAEDGYPCCGGECGN